MKIYATVIRSFELDLRKTVVDFFCGKMNLNVLLCSCCLLFVCCLFVVC